VKSRKLRQWYHEEEARDTAERQLDRPLPYDIVDALRHAALLFDSILQESDDADALQSQVYQP
jgi:hypothetical protein